MGFVVFLTLIGIGTSLVYFLGRDVYATIVVHNVLAMVGIIGSAELDALRQPLYPLYGLAALAVAVLVATHVVIARRAGGYRGTTRA